MQIKFDARELQKAVAKVEKVIPSNPAIAIISGVLIRAAEGGIDLIGTDLENTMRCMVKGEVIEQGEAVIPGRRFCALVKQLDGEIVINTKDNGAEVKSGGKKYDFITFNSAEYPAFPELRDMIEFKLPPQILANGITYTKDFIDKDEPRPHFRGMLLDIQGDTVNFVGTDTRSLSHYKVEKCLDLKDCKVLMPVKSVQILHGLITQQPEITATNNVIAFNFGDTVLVSQLLAGVEDYPDYTKVIPTKNLLTVEMKKSDLMNALKRTAIFASERYSKVSITIGENKAVFGIKSPESGEARESIGIENKEGEITIYFNITALLTAANSVDSETVRFNYTDNKSPAVLRGIEGNEHTVGIMPLKAD